MSVRKGTRPRAAARNALAALACGSTVAVMGAGCVHRPPPGGGHGTTTTTTTTTRPTTSTTMGGGMDHDHGGTGGTGGEDDKGWAALPMHHHWGPDQPLDEATQR
jgi:hypothetical protein